MTRTSPRKIASCMVAVVAATAACGGSSNDPLENARRAVRDGDSVRAVGFFQEYLAVHPDDYEVLKEYTLTLGERWAYDGGDRTPIVQNLQKLYAMRPSDQQIQGLLSAMLVRDGQAAAESLRFEEAEAAYRQAIAVNPESGAAQYHLGLLHEERGNADAALSQYRSAAAKRPQIPDLYLRLGRAYLTRGDVDRAIPTLSLVLELAGISTYLLPDAHCSLAQAYARKEMDAEAQEHLQQAVEGCSLAGVPPITPSPRPARQGGARST